MLQELVSLWPGGPRLSFGDYLIWHRYLFVGLLGCWLAWLTRRPRALTAAGGLVALFTLSSIYLHHPLGRTYGLVAGSSALHEIAQSMVFAVGGASTEGLWLDSVQPYALWSLLLSSASGFDASRLLAQYGWWLRMVPWMLGVAVYAAASCLPNDGSRLPSGYRGVSAVFFVLFLATPRLGFLHDGSVFQTHLFWTRPVLAFGVALAWLWFVGLTRRRWVVIWAPVVALALASVSPTLLLLMGMSTLCIVGDAFLSARELRAPAMVALVSVAAGFTFHRLFGAPGIVFDGPALPIDSMSVFPASSDSVLAMSLDYGLWFYLALGAAWLSFRGGTGRSSEQDAHARWFVYVAGSGWLVFLVGTLWPPLFSALEWDWCLAWARVSMALLASQGFLKLVNALHAFFVSTPDETSSAGEPVPRWLRKLPLERVWSIALGLTLPWCFPFWFLPHQMDDQYRQSVRPISRQILAAMESIREETPKNARFVTGPGYSAWVPALTGRRVLRTHERPRPPVDSERAIEETRYLATAEGDPTESRDEGAPASFASESRYLVDHWASGRLDEQAGFTLDWELILEDPRNEDVFRQQRFMRVVRRKP